jgi:hypothetical protein
MSFVVLPRSTNTCAAFLSLSNYNRGGRAKRATSSITHGRGRVERPADGARRCLVALLHQAQRLFDVLLVSLSRWQSQLVEDGVPGSRKND